MADQFDPRLLMALSEALNQQREVAGDPTRFTKYRDDPVGFAQDILGVHSLWTKQKEILYNIVTERRLAVRSGHGTGKTFVLAIAVIWWVYARKGMVVTTASTWSQVERVLWREIGTLWRKALVPLPGQNFATELRVEPDWYAVGLSTDNPTAFQGIHHPDLLAVLDEAPGIPDLIHDSIGSLTTATGNRTVMIGNPTDPSGKFFEAFDRPIGWTTVHISCLEHPNVLNGTEEIPGAVTRDWVNDKKLEYGEDSPLYQVRVLGEFPSSSDNQLIPMAQVDLSMAHGLPDLEQRGKSPLILGVDIARYGSNRTVAVIRQGDRVLKMWDWQGTATTETTRRVQEIYQNYQPKPAAVVVDETGVGGGVVDQLIENGIPVIGFNAGNRAGQSARFDSLRSESWFRLRERFATGNVELPAHRQLRADLIAPTYSFAPNGRVRVERKDQLRRRGVDSPDFADAVMMAFAVDLLAPHMNELPDFTDTTRDPTVVLTQTQRPKMLGGWDSADSEWGDPSGYSDVGGVPVDWF